VLLKTLFDALTDESDV